jgi:hypothetical protein
MEGGGAGAEGSRMGAAHHLAKFLFKGRDVGTDGGDPVGVKGFLDKDAFVQAQVRAGEEDSWWHGVSIY